MSRIVGCYSAAPQERAAKIKMLLSLVRGPHSRAIAIAAGRCTLGWSGREAPNVAEHGPLIVAVDGLFYNRKELDQAAGLNASTTTDATRLANLYRQHGFDGAVSKINGDFSVALYDQNSDTLWLARDRFGVKPLYYLVQDGWFAFASRPGPLLRLDGVSREVNRRYVATFAGGHYRHIDNMPDQSPFEAVHQLPAATVLRWRQGSIAIHRYWDLSEASDFAAGEAELAASYRDLLLDAVERRIAVADAPAFTLSGGMDSSSVLSCAVERTGNRQQAYSSVYVDPTYDETTEIKPMLDSKVSQWHPVRIGTPDVLGIVRKMVVAHDEPVATATWLSHYLVCEDARDQGFKSLFGGLGGDELNAGEYEYFYFFFADLRRAHAEAALDHEIVEWARHHDHPIYRKSKAGVEEAFKRLVDLATPGVCRPDANRMTRYYATIDRDYFDLTRDPHVMDHPFKSYLKNRTYQDIFRETAPCCLRAEDRQTEAHGMQQINPFFDHRLAEFMFRVPGHMKIRDGITKRLLREAMTGILPEETRQRIKKTGWNAPAHQWFGQGTVADDVQDLIESRAFRERGIYNLKEVDRLLAEHHKIVAEDAVVENHMMFFWQLVNLELWFQDVVVSAQKARTH